MNKKMQEYLKKRESILSEKDHIQAKGKQYDDCNDETDPVDLYLDDKKTQLLQTIEYIQSQETKIKIVSDLAFDAVDLDESNTLELSELSQIIKDVAEEMAVKVPQESDIEQIMLELDNDENGNVDKAEF